MYAIIPLDSSTALGYEALAPFEVRPVLRGLSALPRVHVAGAHLFGRPIGLALAVQSDGTWGTGIAGDDNRTAARLLSVTVARSYRRIGVGRALLRSIEDSLTRAGAGRLQCSYAIASVEGTSAAEALFRSAGWNAPEMTMVQCRADQTLLDAPLMRELGPLPPEYEICDWVDLTTPEREGIAARQREAPWYPTELDPFHYEPELEMMNSLALRYRGEVVGWLLTRRSSPVSVQYCCLFVREDLAKLGRSLSLLTEAIRRHWHAIGKKPGFGEWSTPAALPLMIRFIRRRLVPFGAVVTEQRIVRKTLGAAVDASDLAGALSALPGNTHTDFALPSRAAVLSTTEAAEIRTSVHAAKPAWIARTHTYPFHTLGATAQMDALDGPVPYEQLASLQNPALRERFAPLYAKLQAALAGVLHTRVEYRDAWALPGFSVFHACRGAELPLAPVRCNVQYLDLDTAGADLTRAISFSLTVALPERGGALTEWDLSYDQTLGLDTEETARLLDAAPRTQHELRVGELFVYAGNRYHQTAPMRDPRHDDERITLEGHALLVGGVWQLYG
jgi:GNAT superfamily N-acetyltransferase